jgi:hypothetical protein
VQRKFCACGLGRGFLISNFGRSLENFNNNNNGTRQSGQMFMVSFKVEAVIIWVSDRVLCALMLLCSCALVLGWVEGLMVVQMTDR